MKISILDDYFDTPHLPPAGDACITERPDHAFLEKAVFQGEVGDAFHQITRFTAQAFNLVR